MVEKDTIYGSETYRPYLDIERIINIQSACSVNRGHDMMIEGVENDVLNNSLIDKYEWDQGINELYQTTGK